MRKKEKKTFDRLLGGVPEKRKRRREFDSRILVKKWIYLVNGFEILLLPEKEEKKNYYRRRGSRNIERNNVREIAASKHIVLRKKNPLSPLELCLLFP